MRQRAQLPEFEVFEHSPYTTGDFGPLVSGGALPITVGSVTGGNPGAVDVDTSGTAVTNAATLPTTTSATLGYVVNGTVGESANVTIVFQDADGDEVSANVTLRIISGEPPPGPTVSITAYTPGKLITNDDGTPGTTGTATGSNSIQIPPNGDNDEDPWSTADPLPKDNDNPTIGPDDDDIVMMQLVVDRQDSTGDISFNIPPGYRVFSDSRAVLAETSGDAATITVLETSAIQTVYVEGLDNASLADFTLSYPYTGASGGEDGTAEATVTVTMDIPVEFVTKGANGEFIPQSVTWNSIAPPVISLTDATAWLSSTNSVTLSLSGKINDDTSDCTPTDGKQLTTLHIETPGGTTPVTLGNSAVYDPANLWRPYAFEAQVSELVTIPVAPEGGDYTVKLRTSENAGGLAGAQEIHVHVDTASTAGEAVQLVLSTAYDETQVNQLLLKIGLNPATAEDVALTETEPGTRQFTGISGGSGFSLTLPPGFNGLTPAEDSLQATLTESGASAGTNTLQLALVETGEETNTFVLDASVPGYCKAVSVSPGPSQAPGTFFPTIIRIPGNPSTYAGARTITAHVMDRDWQVKFNNANGTEYWYVVDDTDKPVVFNPSLYAHTDIQTKKVTREEGFTTTFYDNHGEELGTETLHVTQGLIVQGDEVSDLLNGKITGWKPAQRVSMEQSEIQANLYEPEDPTPQNPKPLGHIGRAIETEILWCFVGTKDTVVIFNSREELLRDIQYRKKICEACRERSAGIRFGLPEGNSDYFHVRNNHLAINDGAIPWMAFQDPFNVAHSYLYKMHCNEYAMLAMLNAASLTLPTAEFNSRLNSGGWKLVPPTPPNFLFKRGIGGIIHYRIVPKIPDLLVLGVDEDYRHHWIPGDQGFLKAIDQVDSVLAGENVIYVGDCFDEDFVSHAMFYGHTDQNTQPGLKTWGQWFQKVQGYSPSLRCKVEEERYFLRQPFIQRQ